MHMALAPECVEAKEGFNGGAANACHAMLWEDGSMPFRAHGNA